MKRDYPEHKILVESIEIGDCQGDFRDFNPSQKFKNEKEMELINTECQMERLYVNNLPTIYARCKSDTCTYKIPNTNNNVSTTVVIITLRIY